MRFAGIVTAVTFIVLCPHRELLPSVTTAPHWKSCSMASR